MASSTEPPKPNTPSKRIRWLLPVVLLSLGVLGSLALIKTKAEHSPPTPREKTWYVQVAPLIAGSYSPTLELQGVVEAPSQFRARAPGVGWVKHVGAREGQHVRAGDALISLDEADFEAALIKAETELAEANAQITEAETTHQQNRAALSRERELLRLSQANLERLTQLAEKSLSSQQQRDDAQREHQKQRLSLSQRQLAVNNHDATIQQLAARKKRAEANLAQAHRALQQSQVVAPYDGIVASMKLSAGDRVNPGEELVSVYAADALEVRAMVPARYQDELYLGDTEKPRAFGHDGRPYHLDRLAGIAQVGGIDGFFTPLSDQPSSYAPLRPGGLVTLRLARPSVENSYAVPAATLYNNARLYVMRDGRMVGIDVEQIGHVFTDEGERLLLVKGEDIAPNESLVITRLPNAVSGLKITTEAPRERKAGGGPGKGKPGEKGKGRG